MPDENTCYVLAIDLGTGGPKAALVSDKGDVIASVTESSDSVQESRTTLHSIVNELVAQFDDLREEVERLLVTEEEADESNPADTEPEPSGELVEALARRSG